MIAAATHPSLPVIVIDGQNLAVSGGRSAEASKGDREAVRPRVSALFAAIDYFRQRAFDTVAFVPEWWLRTKGSADIPMVSSGHRPAATHLSLLHDEALAIRLLVEAGIVCTVPAKDHDDPYLLEFAWQKRGFVLSNDRFLDQAQRWIQRAGEREARAGMVAAKGGGDGPSMLLDDDESPAASSSFSSSYPHTPDLESKVDWWKTHIISYALRPLPSAATSTATAAEATFEPRFELLPNPLKMELLPSAVLHAPVPTTMELLRQHYEKKRRQQQEEARHSDGSHRPGHHRPQHYYHHDQERKAVAASAEEPTVLPPAPSVPLDATIVKATVGGGDAFLLGPGADFGSFLQSHMPAAPSLSSFPAAGGSAAVASVGHATDARSPAAHVGPPAPSSALAAILPRGAEIIR